MDIISYILNPANESNIQKIREIRNECRFFMTRNRDYITEEQQENWFNNIDENNLVPFIFSEVSYGVMAIDIGYGLIRIEDNCCLVTGGLLEKYRNRGAGKILFEMIIEKCKQYNKPIKLEVLKTNERALKLYKSMGFKVYDQDDKVYFMVRHED